MIYALVIANAVWAGAIILVVRVTTKERADLIDRIMALSQPEALITHKALTDPEPGEVSYMDEVEEAKVGNNYHELGED